MSISGLGRWKPRSPKVTGIFILIMAIAGVTGSLIGINISKQETLTSLNCKPAFAIYPQDIVSCTVSVVNASPLVISRPSGNVTMQVMGCAPYLDGLCAYPSFDPTSCALVVGSCTLNVNTTGFAVWYTSVPYYSGKFVAKYVGDDFHLNSSSKFTEIIGWAPTSTVVTCTPDTITVNVTVSTCTAIVSDISPKPTAPRGSIEWENQTSFIRHAGWCTLSSVTATSSSCSLQFSSSQPSPSGMMIVYAHFNAASQQLHSLSTGKFALTLLS